DQTKNSCHVKQKKIPAPIRNTRTRQSPCTSPRPCRTTIGRQPMERFHAHRPPTIYDGRSDGDRSSGNPAKTRSDRLPASGERRLGKRKLLRLRPKGFFRHGQDRGHAL